MADTEDIAKVLYDYVTDKVGYLTDGDEESIQERVLDIVNWLMPTIQMKEARDFVRKMKAFNEQDTEAQEETRTMDETSTS